MWKPGTRVVEVSNNTKAAPIGTTGTVVHNDFVPGYMPRGYDACVLPDGHHEGGAIRSCNWRPIDTNDTTGLTASEALRQALRGQKVEA